MGSYGILDHFTQWQLVPITCFVSKITDPLNSQPIEIAVNRYPHLHNLYLADSNPNNRPLPIDILIGGTDEKKKIKKGFIKLCKKCK